jgi:hypothetical protein
MGISRRDWIFIICAGMLLGLLMIKGAGRKGTRLPADTPHLPFAASLAKGVDRELVEKGCPVCHNPAARPLPAGHPPKEQCLICHPP